jgi:tRNA-2-methylthio-N6-dimethylallyladenosine synthase
MKRGYTVEDYREMISRIRQQIPGAAVSSDFIVGFCGETEGEFQQTVELVRECRFKNSFIFKYSERPQTKAADRLPDDVPLEVKRRRNNELLALQNAISLEDNQALIGRVVQVLVEGPSKAAANTAEPGPPVQMTGRTICDRIVVFDGNLRQTGQMLPVTIYDVSSHTLFGHVVTEHASPEVYTLEHPIT